MKRTFITLLIFILPMILLGQDQKTSQEPSDEERWSDIDPDRELAQPPRLSNPDVIVQVMDNEDSLRNNNPDRELAQPPRLSNPDVIVQVMDNEDSLRNNNPDREDHSESYKTED
jgi:hypothetical protein